MPITSVLNDQTILATALNNTKTAEDIAAEDAEEQQQEFLTLLLTQLENQNPLDPMDTDEYSAQLTRYSQLEQQISTNEKLAVMSDTLDKATAAASFSYIGQTVEVASNVGTFQDGNASWSYVVDDSAEDVMLTITNDSGDILYEADGSAFYGAHHVSVTADDLEGDVAEGEALTLFVTATDSDGETVAKQVTSHITIDGLWADEGETYLTAGSVSVSIDGVLKVLEEGTAS